jgi:hypothetical protein
MDYQQPSTFPEAAPPPQKKAPPMWLMIVGGIFACICIGCAGFAAFGYFIGEGEKKAYAEGHAAYLAGDCTTAISKYDSLTGEDIEATVAPELEQCQFFQSAKTQHEVGNHAAALDGYLAAASVNSGFDSTLSPELDRLFTEATPDQLVSEELCSDITSISGNVRLAAINANAADLYAECGDFLSGLERYDEAVNAYDLFLAQYPDHERAGDVETAMADALLRSAKAAGAGEIERPQVSGTTGTGNTRVVIQNDSPESMRIIFTGPETRIEELAACPECETFGLVGPAFCPEKGPVGTYDLPPGTYEVLVESTSDSGTTPFTGTWELAAGDEYYSCFYVTEGQ